MVILKFNPEIRTKLSYSVPVSYGDPQYEKKKMFSFSLYENNVIREIVFLQNRVVKHYFNQNQFLSTIENFDQSSKLVRAVNFELFEESDTRLKFREFLHFSEVGNHGILENQGNDQFYLGFHRVASYLGYKISAKFFGNNLSLFKEEHYFKEESGTPVLDKVF